MKKQRKPKPAKRVKTGGQTPSQTGAGGTSRSDAVNRRHLLRLARNVLIAGGLVGGGGYALARTVLTTMYEHDLDRIGNGRPTVVQIHDPSCSMCMALQRETRKALERIEGDPVDYVVANISTPEGRNFAASHGVQHVTLLLFDAGGDLRDVLVGERRSYQIEVAIKRLYQG